MPARDATPRHEGSRQPRAGHGQAPRARREVAVHAAIEPAIALQSAIGNRAVSRLIEGLAPKPPPALMGTALQRKLERGSGTGWGGIMWVDNQAKALWEALDRKYNTEMAELLTDLRALLDKNPFATDTLTPVIERITGIQAKWDGPIQYKKAPELDGLLDAVLKDGGDAKKAVPEQRAKKVDALVARLGSPLTSMVIDFAKTGLKAQDRKDLLAKVQAAKNASTTFDDVALTKEVETLESRYAAARDKTAELKKQSSEEAEKQRKLEEEQAAKSKAEKEAEDAKRALIAKKMPSYQSALVKCDGDLDKLVKLVGYIKLGEGGQLDNCLALAHADDLLGLFEKRALPVKTMNQLLTALGKGKASTLSAMLEKFPSGEEDRLKDIIDEAPESEVGLLPSLREKFALNALEPLLKQGTPAKLTDLFVTKALSAPITTALLTTSAKPHVVDMLEKVPKPELLQKMQPVAPSPDALKAMVTEIKAAPVAITKVQQLFARPNVATTWAEVEGVREVQDARGLRTNAGALIPMTTPSSLAGTGEKTAVEEALAAIDGGVPQALTHSNGAKFGDAFGNDQGRLPGPQGGGGYKEYYVEKDPASGTYHGDRRIVVSNTTGYAYYTDDHYATFKRIR